MGWTESPNLKNDYERACGWYGHSTRAKWRSSPSARIGTLKIRLTPPTLSERRFNVNHGPKVRQNGGFLYFRPVEFLEQSYYPSLEPRLNVESSEAERP